MTAALRTCTECAIEFHGRADAAYCSPTCRQKAYRDRRRHVTAIRNVTDEPVPIGDGWAIGRFTHYGYRGGRRTKQAIAKDGLLHRFVTLVHEVDQVAARDELGQSVYEVPVGDCLPADITPEFAESMAESLKGALPRLAELAALLERRGREKWDASR